MAVSLLTFHACVERGRDMLTLPSKCSNQRVGSTHLFQLLLQVKEQEQFFHNVLHAKCFLSVSFYFQLSGRLSLFPFN